MNIALNKAAGAISRTSSIEEVFETLADVKRLGKAWGLNGSMPFSPAYDHAPLPSESQIDAVRAAVAPKIDVLIGYNHDEATLLVGEVPLIGRLTWLPLVGSWLQDSVVHWLIGRLYRHSAIELARKYKGAGGNASLYEFTYCVPGNRMKSNHGLELSLLFPNKTAWAGGKGLQGVDWDEHEVKGRAFRGLWADFARGRQLVATDGVPGLVTLLDVSV